jgi:hypothetical protein
VVLHCPKILPSAGGQIVNDYYGTPLVQKAFDEVGADESGAAGDQGV